MTATARTREVRSDGEAGTLQRYGFFERALHWFVALTFGYLMLSGFALGYPRMAWLGGVLGGGQAMRWLHPVVGVAFTVGVAAMVLVWFGENRFSRADAEWLRRVPTYARSGHTGLDLGKYNAGQKGFFWATALAGLGLLVTGVPLWVPQLTTAGWLQVARLVHHLVFVLFVLAVILHVYLSTAMFPGTISAMTSGRVERRWAAWHHPRWFREQDSRQRAEK